jgi:hypothetical protein
VSHQGYEGWFPECLVCGGGNVGAVVCLNPTCHEAHEGQLIASATERLVQADSHWWKLCHWCDRPIRADGGAWGTYALCIECWNSHAAAGILPPASPGELARAKGLE